MSAAIMMRVIPENYEQWIREHDGCRTARSEYGMTDGPVYRDQANPNVVMVQLDCEDLERAKKWFADDRFKAGVARAGKVHRDVYFAQPKLG